MKRKISIYFLTHRKEKLTYKNELYHVKHSTFDSDTYSHIFPYPFVRSIDWKTIIVNKDITNGLYYVLHKGKRLYFHKGVDSVEKVQIAYYCAAIEQHPTSPHCYLSDQFNIEQDNVVFDVGAAEGILGLEHIENIKRLYIFEAESRWMPALTATFAPWKGKVIFVNKYVSNVVDDCHITLDSFLLQEPVVDLIKIDVEGMEHQIFEGGANLLEHTSHIAVATYHRQDDDKEINEYLKSKGFHTQYSDGFMLFVLDKLTPPYFRKGIIRAIKNYE